MSRPATLSEAIRRSFAGGERGEHALDEFCDAFYLAPAQARPAMLAEEPPPTGDARLDALAGAVAEYLAKQHRLPAVPEWASGPGRRLDAPWFTTPTPSKGMREYLVFASPAEFRWRNIFTDLRPLRRARGG
jgi:hypothetical protein